MQHLSRMCCAISKNKQQRPVVFLPQELSAGCRVRVPHIFPLHSLQSQRVQDLACTCPLPVTQGMPWRARLNGAAASAAATSGQAAIACSKLSLRDQQWPEAPSALERRQVG